MRYVARYEHAPEGDPCLQCGRNAASHRKRKRVRTTYFQGYNAGRTKLGCVAIDGEGVTLPDGRHIYVYMAAADGERDLGDIANPTGLSSKQIFDFLCSLPQDRLKVGYGLGYDKTLWIRDLPDDMIWILARPELRQTVKKNGKPGQPHALEWDEYKINLVHKRFTIRKGKRACTVWDFLGFFQRTFVKSLSDWEIGSKEELARIQDMKDQRGNFSALTAEQVQAYCRSECRLMAQLADKLIQSHRDANLTLRSYYGAGSTASVLLDRYHAREEIVQTPEAMADPVQRAFFGGRFEISRIGPVKGVIHQYDIASAYPYAMSQLPCFRCGKWELQKRPSARVLEISRAALVHYNLSQDSTPTHSVSSAYGVELASPKPWAPLPFRRSDGNIVFPQTGKGWVWKDEYLSAQRFSANTSCTEAWIYQTDCGCPPPFAGFVEEFARRIEWGKSGKGQVMKLGLNSCYGKRAQRTGARTYRCMVSAGNITSITRARLLDAIQSCPDRSQILSVATDGLLSLAPLPLEATEKVFGGWEYSTMSKGVFMLRPGFEFSLALSDTGSVKARGAGKGVVTAQREQILEQWDRAPGSVFTLGGRTLFRGMKTSITRSSQGYKRRDYAAWKEQPMDISYAPTPKRPYADSDWRLHTWALDANEESSAYDRSSAALSVALREMKDMEGEQPDAVGED